MGPIQRKVLEVLMQAEIPLSVGEIIQNAGGDNLPAPPRNVTQLTKPEVHAALSGMGKCLGRHWVVEVIENQLIRSWKITPAGVKALEEYQPPGPKPKPKKIMLMVMGTTGEGDFEREWPVCLYRPTDRFLAERHAKGAQRFSERRGGEIARIPSGPKYAEITKEWWTRQCELGNPYDPAIGVVLDATYRVAEIEIRTEVPRDRPSTT